ncbi:tyrosine-type recombinase/integrase [Sphingomicrobium aestuariivivum]|uniref:tyrosine-type recombinase/integrase n=1 Tax=Sphingomicrobium aestuariivivum TaxID=1582356 RepID=UPI001FD64674|nr:tyrosine-type recombinase/integrase [Sphingomicrobium aestuariivivum]MCJ8191979.1 tyrosine-type recombinase/integrase [Sphingomicrobium aestuariivivum]
MTFSEFDPATQNRVPWNAGAQVGPKRPLNKNQIWAVRFFLDREQRIRDRALFDLAIDSKLRGCDLVELKIGDLVSGTEIRRRATVTQRKTGRPVQFEIAVDARTSLFAWLELRGGSVDDFVFPSRVDHSKHLSTRQYARLLDEWVTAIGLRREEYGTHSLRRTKASIIYKATGNLRAIQILLGHSKIENTVRYLGVDIEDALTLAEKTGI